MESHSSLIPFSPLVDTQVDLRGLTDWAVRLAKVLVLTDVVLLRGHLGAGKTTFARAMLREGFGVTGDIPSPTFPILCAYEIPRGPVYHYDLYRIKSPLDLTELAMEDALTGAITLVEWPERVPHAWQKSALEVTLSFVDPSDETQTEDAVHRRRLRLCGDASWARRLNIH